MSKEYMVQVEDQAAYTIGEHSPLGAAIAGGKRYLHVCRDKDVELPREGYFTIFVDGELFEIDIEALEPTYEGMVKYKKRAKKFGVETLQMWGDLDGLKRRQFEELCPIQSYDDFLNSLKWVEEEIESMVPKEEHESVKDENAELKHLVQHLESIVEYLEQKVLK